MFFEVVGKICGVLRLAVDLRFWSVRLVERETYLIMHVLHLNVDVSFKVLCIWNRTRGGSS